MSASVLEAGSVESSDDVHAVRRRLNGAIALCGAGAIVRIVAGRFDPEAPNACAACAAAAGDA